MIGGKKLIYSMFYSRYLHLVYVKHSAHIEKYKAVDNFTPDIGKHVHSH